MIIKPSNLAGTVRVPSSKSIGHRLLICAGLAAGESQIYGLHMSKDIAATMAALKQLGVEMAWVPSSDSEEEAYWRIVGIGTQNTGNWRVVGLDEAPIRIHCGESGSTLRFMIPVAMGLRSHVQFDGDGRLAERPIDAYFPIINKNGMHMEYTGKLPLTLTGQLDGGRYELSGKVSSQYTTGLLLAAPILPSATTLVIVDDMESQGYIDLTIDCMRQFGVVVNREGYQRFMVAADQSYHGKSVHVEGDYSQAAFWIVAGLIGKEPIGLQGLRSESLQGDLAVLEITARMGGQLEWRSETLWVTPSQTRGTVIDASQCPDLIPVLCVLAALSRGETRVINGQRLRVKESDRILATVTELKKMGADIEETHDGMVIQGKDMLIGGCFVDSWNDHRIVMAAAVASTRCTSSITIDGAEAVAKSYPHFFDDFRLLGGEL